MESRIVRIDSVGACPPRIQVPACAAVGSSSDMIGSQVLNGRQCNPGVSKTMNIDILQGESGDVMAAKRCPRPVICRNRNLTAVTVMANHRTAIDGAGVVISEFHALKIKVGISGTVPIRL